MIDRTATIGLVGLVLAAIAVVGYLAGVLSGTAASVLVGLAGVLAVVWFVGALIEGARSENRR